MELGLASLTVVEVNNIYRAALQHLHWHRARHYTRQAICATHKGYLANAARWSRAAIPG
jgi:hypothetical protein